MKQIFYLISIALMATMAFVIVQRNNKQNKSHRIRNAGFRWHMAL